MGLPDRQINPQYAGRSVILTGIMEHGEEMHEEGHAVAGIIPFDDVLDRTQLQLEQPVTDIEEMQQRGWNGTVSLVAHFEGKVWRGDWKRKKH